MRVFALLYATAIYMCLGSWGLLVFLFSNTYPRLRDALVGLLVQGIVELIVELWPALRHQ